MRSSVVCEFIKHFCEVFARVRRSFVDATVYLAHIQQVIEKKDR